MTESAEVPGDRDDRVAAVLQAHLEALDAGRSADRAALLADHPDLGPDLAAFFETADRLAGCAAWLLPEGAGAGVPPPERLAGYEVLGELGRGGMGVVYKARHPALNRVVALKVLRAADPAGVPRLLAEARAAARLDHPGVVPVFEVGEDAGRPFLVMAFVPGDSLAARAAAGPVPNREAAGLVRDAARAVQHAHDHGVVHRDLKPANILVGPDGRAKVTDFGLATRSGEETLTADGQVLGTPAYMPPEVAAGGARRAGPAADVYGLGGVLYALLTGRPPFAGATPLHTLRRVAEDDPVPPRAVNPGASPELQAVCLKCLAKDPRHRYPSAAELATDLDRYLAGETPLAERLGWGEWLGRKLDRATDVERARAWSLLFAGTAAAFPAAYAGFFLATRGATSAETVWLAFLAAMALSTWLPCLAAARMARLNSHEREVVLSWLAISLGQLVLFAGRCPPAGDARPDEIGRFFADSAALYGVTFFAHGRPYWGRLYLLGLACFAAAIGLRAAGAAAPLLYGGWQTVAFLTIARHMHRVAGTQPRTVA